MSPARSVGHAVRELAAALEQAGIDGAARDARVLMAGALGIPPGRLSLHEGDALAPAAATLLRDYTVRRLERQPISHILGRRAFYEHEFEISPDVLDPRPETEALVGAALSGTFDSVLDLGTGSGAILLSLLAARRSARGVGTDLSQAALDVAGRNAGRLGVADRASFVRSDWFEGVTGRFDLIVSNPPYIALEEMVGLAPELAFEPRLALTDEKDGLTAYRAICAGAGAHLVPGGRVMVEIGWRQGPPVAGLMQEAGLVDVRILPDLDGRDRVVCAGVPA
ncbi:peptide chain release factor N(5)-glutamine methyltransferase [Roseovarius sp. S4756]|uniref:peptide chain release factor N(5)-glutamine methyltransferase n=1 Tax=Roseovarius maritimus TaxID=3342637 RepID=UPI003728430C